MSEVTDARNDLAGMGYCFVSTLGVAGEVRKSVPFEVYFSPMENDEWRIAIDHWEEEGK